MEIFVLTTLLFLLGVVTVLADHFYSYLTKEHKKDWFLDHVVHFFFFVVTWVCFMAVAARVVEAVALQTPVTVQQVMTAVIAFILAVIPLSVRTPGIDK